MMATVTAARVLRPVVLVVVGLVVLVVPRRMAAIEASGQDRPLGWQPSVRRMQVARQWLRVPLLVL